MAFREKKKNSLKIHWAWHRVRISRNQIRWNNRQTNSWVCWTYLRMLTPTEDSRSCIDWVQRNWICRRDLFSSRMKPKNLKKVNWELRKKAGSNGYMIPILKRRKRCIRRPGMTSLYTSSSLNTRCFCFGRCFSYQETHWWFCIDI